MPPLSTAAVAALLFTSSALATPTPRLRESAKVEKRGFRASAPRHMPLRKRDDTGDVSAKWDGGGWILPVTIGGQTVTLNIDTGSSDIWTASTLMPADQQSTVTTGTIFDPTKSSTFQYMDGSTYGIGYADGSGSSGQVGIDVINIGGAQVTMPFGVTTNLTYSGGTNQGSRDTDGPVGLGFGQENSIRPQPQGTFMEYLSSQVPDPVFCTKFKLDDTGFVDFGYVDSTQYTGDVTSIPIDNSTGQWFATNVQFGSGGTVFGSTLSQMDFDTGTSTLNVPADVASGYFALVSGAGQDSNGSWNYPCGNTLPDFDFVFSGVNSGPATVTIPGSNLQASSDGTTCYTWISVTDGGGNAGVPFYISEFLMFDQSAPALSFAAQS